jgi:hypothetical protein
MVRFAPALLLAALVPAADALADQGPGTAKILAPWEANGQVYQVAVDKLEFLGTFDGIMYIEHGRGLLDAALFTCPSTQITEVLSNKSKTHGYCTIESPNGDYIYAEYNCEGEPGACAGKFTLTGGTGKLTGITGESDIIIRTALSGTTVDQTGGATVSAAKGLAIWPEMHFDIPGKASDITGMFGGPPTTVKKAVEPKKPEPIGNGNKLDKPVEPLHR